MSHELFFIPIIAEALKRPDVQHALENAFATIQRMGHEADYEEGYGNFQAFMAELDARRNLLHEQDVRTAILMSTTGDPGEARDCRMVLDSEIRESPEFKAECDVLREALRPRPRVSVLQLLRDGHQVEEMCFETIPGRHTIADIRPGHYGLRMDTGLIIWEGELTTKDLIWSQAFGGRSLELAAKAGGIQQRPPNTIHVPHAGVTLRLFPGLESGSLEIELNR